MEVLIYLLLIAFIIRTIRNVLYQTFLWQLKEYRIDRFVSHLKTNQGRKLIFGPSASLKWIFLLFIVAGILFEYDFLFDTLSLWANLGFGIIWIIEAVISLKDLIKKRWRIPKFTFKVVFILIIILILQFSPLLVSGNIIQQLMVGPFLDKLLAPSIALFIIILNVPSLTIKKIILLLAKKKIAQFHKLTVIGITGSYGKTSTKEFLATILSEKFKVAKTPEFTNTDIGIAKFILKELKPDHEIFVVEMGAYKKGEIKAICDMVKPKIGMITGIDEQHIELFGSLENTIRAKYELIESLPLYATVVINGNNIHCLEMAKRAKKQQKNVEIFRTAKDVCGIKVYKDHLEFVFDVKNKKYPLNVHLLGAQNIENVLGAIYMALTLKMDMESVKRGVSKIKPPDKTMKLYKNPSGLSLIDDTFNANPSGVLCALSYMKLYKGKKILVLTPLIELGEKGSDIHQKLGKTAAPICDLYLLTNPNFKEAFCKGLVQGGGDVRKVHVVNKATAIEIINKFADYDSVVVFEGKEAGKIINDI